VTTSDDYFQAMASTLPPGLDGNAQEAASGGSGDWLSFDKRKSYTNAFIVEDYPTETRVSLRHVYCFKNDKQLL
jgi:hypothetical protein